MRFVTGGGLRVDTLIAHDGQVHDGLAGGNALYAAVGAAIWIDEINVWARAGENYPQDWLATLSQHGLGIEGVVRVRGRQDHRTFYAYTEDGRRDDTDPAAHFARINRPLPEMLADYVDSTPGQADPNQYEPLALRPSDWPVTWDEDLEAPGTAVHLSPLPLLSHRRIPAVLRDRGVDLISVDPGERYMSPEHIPAIRRFLPWLDAFLPSEQEVYSLFGEEIELWEAAETLCEWGAPLIVIKHGPGGVLMLEKSSGRRIHLPAYHRAGDPRVVDVTGAGDAFCGGFLVGLGQTGDPIVAAKMGLVSASFVVEGYGALYALEHSADRMDRLAALAGN